MLPLPRSLSWFLSGWLTPDGYCFLILPFLFQPSALHLLQRAILVGEHQIWSGSVSLPNSICQDLAQDCFNNTMKVKVKLLVAQLYPTLCNPMDCSLPGSSVHGILQARILAAAAAAKLLQLCPTWVAIPFSRGSSQLRDWSWVSCIAGEFFTIWTHQPRIVPPKWRKNEEK